MIGFDESGFSGNEDETYRKQAWRFIMSGGGLFNSLDYSFTTDSPEGTAIQKAPGGGSRNLRRQLNILKGFIESFDFLKMKPITIAGQGDKIKVYHLAEVGKQHAFYFEDVDQGRISLPLPAGNYAIDLHSVEDGTIQSLGKKNHQGGELQLEIPGLKSYALSAIAL